MYKKHKIGIVVPAFNEETQIEITITTIPEFADRIIVVDDCSTDATSEIIKRIAFENERVVFIRHEKNTGVGAAISTGYIWCRENDMDVVVVMAGDGQMDPHDLSNLLDSVVEDRADYSKGNRLVTGEAWKIIPKARYLGNAGLTLLTRLRVSPLSGQKRGLFKVHFVPALNDFIVSTILSKNRSSESLYIQRSLFNPCSYLYAITAFCADGNP